ncbi:LytTR family DNA-binding domain-containing protein [Tenacibaculum ovolyticum]|uniref:LytTR family DNA-binding domain-containing protein n=1 Tax=Tenacibaculum ovolyticum TaxID=104270 RepID=UPI003BADAE85
MNKEYPLNKNIKNHLWISLALGIWIFMFLFFAEPFDINRFTKIEKITLLPIYGIIQSICYCIPLWYQHKFNQNKWSFKKEFIFIGLMILIGFCINFLFYKNFVAYNEPETYNYYHYFKWIYLPALAIILPFILIGRYITGKFSENNIIEDKIVIKGKGKLDFIALKPNELVFVKSSDNYIEVNFLEKDIIKKKIIRETISEVQKSFPFLLKTHRSFLINPLHFKHFKTENKKLLIEVGFGYRIPVSRNLQASIKSELQIATNK